MSTEATMSKATGAPRECVGRFSWLQSQPATVAGRSQSIYRTNISHLPVPPEGIDAFWAAKLAKLGAEHKGFSLAPQVMSSWSSRNPSFPAIRTLEVLKPVSGGILLADTEADAGKEEMTEGLMKDIINGFEPTTDYGFCIGGGAIMLEPSQFERAGLVLHLSAAPEVEIHFETRTVTEPDTTTYSDVDEEESLATAHGGKLVVLRNAERSVAGLTGKEIRISIASPKEQPLLRFTWHYPGIPGSSTNPAIDILAASPATDQAQLESAWESMLTSLRTVPLPANPK